MMLLTSRLTNGLMSLKMVKFALSLAFIVQLVNRNYYGWSLAIVGTRHSQILLDTDEPVPVLLAEVYVGVSTRAEVAHKVCLQVTVVQAWAAGRSALLLELGAVGCAQAPLRRRGVCSFVATYIHLSREIVGCGHTPIGVIGWLNAFLLNCFFDYSLESLPELH